MPERVFPFLNAKSGALPGGHPGGGLSSILVVRWGREDIYVSICARGSILIARKGAAKPEQKRAGAKGKYHDWITPEGLETIRAWMREGYTEKNLADRIGVAVSTLSDWKARFPEFLDALKEGKDVADARVESALYMRALGYTYEEITDEDNPEKGHTHKVVKKHVLPDVTAQIFWLKNRRPDRWRDKPPEDIDTEDIGATRAEVYGDEKP